MFMVNPQEVGYQPEIEFYNQLDSFPEYELIGQNACGLAVLAMGINLSRSREKLSGNTVTPKEVLTKTLEIQDIPKTSTKWLHVKGEPEWLINGLPIGLNIPPKLQREINAEPEKYSILGMIDTASNYHPIFTLTNGLDHRGAPLLLKEYGISADQFGDNRFGKRQSGKKVEQTLSQGNIVLSSVEHSEDSSHVVMFAGVRDGIDGVEILEYDPLETEPKWKQLSEIENKFRGYGTIIYGKIEDNHDQA